MTLTELNTMGINVNNTAQTITIDYTDVTNGGKRVDVVVKRFVKYQSEEYIREAIVKVMFIKYPCKLTEADIEISLQSYDLTVSLYARAGISTDEFDYSDIEEDAKQGLNSLDP